MAAAPCSMRAHGLCFRSRSRSHSPFTQAPATLRCSRAAPHLGRKMPGLDAAALCCWALGPSLRPSAFSGVRYSGFFSVAPSASGVSSCTPGRIAGRLCYSFISSRCWRQQVLPSAGFGRLAHSGGLDAGAATAPTRRGRNSDRSPSLDGW